MKTSCELATCESKNSARCQAKYLESEVMSDSRGKTDKTVIRSYNEAPYFYFSLTRF